MEISTKQHYRDVRYVLLLTLGLNWLVALVKIIYGALSHCTSIVADGLHSLSDGLSNIIGLIGVNLASQPKDKDHPYGHKKYETFFSLGIALLLFILALSLAHNAIERIKNPTTPKIDARSFIIMLLTMIINTWVMYYERKKGKALKSDILISDAMHTKADIFTSLSVIVALIIIKLGVPILDPVVTIIIAVFIAHTGLKIAKESSTILCDTVAILDIKKIEDVVLGVKGVKACHKIRTRGRPDDICVDLHVQVSGNMHIDNAHKISYAIEEAIKKDIPEITDVVVHMEPK
ncbi:MAG: cation diffusion facilitator family transporter [Candidatus Omnitrophota bacterium]|nr:cation diffusion facilitator family transporter [Candidatus Omnitrophota bacterium]